MNVLTNMGIISDETVSGRVISTAGTPINNATVSAQCWLGETSLQDKETKTNIDGEFYLSPIPGSADCRIRVFSEGYYAGWMDISEKCPRNNIQFVLGEGISLSGRAITRSGIPIPNARISWERMKDKPPPQPGQMVIWTVDEKSISDASGHFIIEHVGPGKYRFNVYVDDGNNKYHQQSIGKPASVESDKNIEDIEVIFNDPEEERIEGFVRDESGEPIPEITLDAYTYTGEYWSTKTDLTGHYRIIGVGDHSLSIDCRPPSCDGIYAHVQLKNVRVGTYDADITMPRSSCVQGMVLDAISGKPVRDAEVSLVRIEPKYNSCPGLYTEHPSAKTNDNGVFQLSEVLPGKVVLAISAPDYMNEQVSEIVLEPGKSTPGIDIRLEKGNTPKIVPPEDPSQCATIMGTVLNLDKTPITAEQGIYLEYLDKPVHEVPAGYIIHDGQYKIERLIPGTYEIRAWVRGNGHSTEQSQIIRASAGETTTVDFALDFPVIPRTPG